ncbi:hypothetical protein B0T14DRAFT_433602 [Immersiella caudata]|uniref:F-box domain-containing protein n=1 Tax=Immersiella caudata TaxID=314043 RepID=A0AA40BXZ6_9PEZI|nr:hypothetical protein B0T14DRAFT_433602 [Immersiella caudata]
MATAIGDSPSASGALPLSTLPTEVLCVIIAHLDPISLIAVSQTSRLFRTIISPSHNDFVQRLLALELLPQYGGIVPLFRARDNALTPPWDDPIWHANKYACCVCHRLRSHMWFDNHSILRLGTRKPPPGSREATKITDWEPLELRDPAVRWKRIQRRAAEEEELLGPERRVYRRFCNGADNMDGTLMRPDFQPIDRRAEQAEMMVCGRERHKRACNECRQRRGDFEHQKTVMGIGGAPVLRSRKIAFPDAFERHLPGFIDFLLERTPDPALLPPRPYPRVFKVWHDERRDEPWTMYTAYCVSCSEWQELAAFRHYIPWAMDDPARPVMFGREPNLRGRWPAPCNKCAQEASFTFPSQVTNEAISLAKSLLPGIKQRLVFGWNMLYEDFKYADRLAGFPAASERILSGLPYVANPENRHDIRKVIQINEDVLPVLRSRIWDVRAFMKELPSDTHGQIVDSWFRLWLEDYELNDACYVRMLKVIKLLEASDYLLPTYFQERDPYRLPSPRALHQSSVHGTETSVSNLSAR